MSDKAPNTKHLDAQLRQAPNIKHLDAQLRLLRGENRLLHLATQFAENILDLVEHDFDPIVEHMAELAAETRKQGSL
jgi:hypothetical protein